MASRGVVYVACLYVATIVGLLMFCLSDAPKDEEISPIHLTLNTTSRMVVATLVRNQAPYLPEWIEFHHMLGCDLFLVYDHYSDDNTSDVLAPYVNAGLVVLIDALAAFPDLCIPTDGYHKQCRCQMSVFNHALAAVRGKTRWMGNFDVDEFIYPVRGSFAGTPSLVDALDKMYAAADAVSLTEMTWGGNGLEKMATPDADGNILVTELFTHRASAVLTNDKFDDFRFGRKTLYNPERVRSVEVHDVVCAACCSVCGVCWKTIYACARAEIQPLASNIRVNHYRFRSREVRHPAMVWSCCLLTFEKQEQEQKALINGNPDLRFDPRVDAIVNEVEDLEIQYLLPALKRNLLLRTQRGV